MENETTYEQPEIFEIGDADEMTLGKPNLSQDDNCECTKGATPSS